MSSEMYIEYSLYEDSLCVMTLPDRVDYNNVQKLENDIKDILRENNSLPVILDFRNCTYMNSSGLRLIISLNELTTRKNLLFAIVNVNQYTKDLIQLADLHHMVTMYETIDEASSRLKG